MFERTAASAIFSYYWTFDYIVHLIIIIILLSLFGCTSEF